MLVVGERLGLPDERVRELTPDEAAAGQFADPNVVLVLPSDRSGEPAPRVTVAGHRGPAGWALPVEAYEHRDSMITKPEVRAVVLARLGPRLGDVVWDVGAGSGSVAVECARFGADVHAVERDPADAERVRRNAAAHGVHVAVTTGAAPEALARLPQPDAVFVGGGGLPVVEACVGRAPGPARRRPGDRRAGRPGAGGRWRRTHRPPSWCRSARSRPSARATGWCPADRSSSCQGALA